MKKGTKLVIVLEHEDHPFKKGEVVAFYEDLKREDLIWATNENGNMALIHKLEYKLKEESV